MIKNKIELNWHNPPRLINSERESRLHNLRVERQFENKIRFSSKPNSSPMEFIISNNSRYNGCKQVQEYNRPNILQKLKFILTLIFNFILTLVIIYLFVEEKK